MDQEELIELVKNELTCRSFWKVFDSNQEWSIYNIIIPYLKKHLTSREQMHDLHQALYLAEIKDDN